MKKDFIINVSYYGLLFAVVFVFVKYVVGFVLPILIGLMIALILQPISKIISKKINVNIKMSIFLVVSIFYALVFALFYIIFAKIFGEIKSIELNMQDLNLIFEKIYIVKQTADEIFIKNGFSNTFIDIFNVFITQANGMIIDLSLYVAKYISNIAKTLPSVMLNIILIVLSSFLASFEYDFLNEMFKKPKFRVVCDIKNCVLSTLSTFATSYLIILCITFFELSLGFYLIRIENFMQIAFFISLFDVLPAVGIGFFIIPWALCELFLGNTMRFVNLLVVYIMCVVIRNIIEPKLLSEQIGISPLVTIICMILGAKIFGVLGALFAPFVLIVIKKMSKIGYFNF